MLRQLPLFLPVRAFVLFLLFSLCPCLATAQADTYNQPAASASTQAIHPSSIYRWDNVLDADPSTCWGVYRGDTSGQWVEVDIGRELHLSRMGIVTGCSGKRSAGLCARPKKIVIHAAGRSIPALLKDSPEKQYVRLGLRARRVRVEVLDTYPLAGNPQAPLTCVADLEFVRQGGVRYEYRQPEPQDPNTVKTAEGLVLTASSKLFSAEGDRYGPGSLMDGDRATPWAEGSEDHGPGEWVQVTFPSSVVLDSMTVLNGYQDDRAYRRHNRVKVLDLEFSDGTTRQVNLADEKAPQTVELGSVRTRYVRLIVREVYFANPLRHHGDTAIGELQFTYADQEEDNPDAETTGSTESTAPAVTVSQASVPASPGQRAGTEQTEAPSRPQAGKTASVHSPEHPAEAGDTDQKEQSSAKEATGRAMADDDAQQAPRDEAPEARESVSAFMMPVREYYRRLLTLDESFPELFSSDNYDQELFTFEHFKAIQRQLGTEKKLKNAVVDLSGLRFRPRSLGRNRARVEVSGSYAVYAGTAFVEQAEDSLFTLVWEKGGWKIEDKEDFGD